MLKGKVERVTLERLGDYYYDDNESVLSIIKASYPNKEVKLIKKTKKEYHFDIK